MNQLDHLKRILSYCLIGSVICGAGLGVFSVLKNTWSWFEIRVLLTTMIFAAASLCGLACDISRSPRGLNVLPYSGLLLVLLSTVMLLVLVWAEPSWTDFDSFWRLTWCLSVFAIATAHVSLLSAARLAPRFQWTILLAYCIIYGLASLVCALVLRSDGPDGESLMRPIAVLAILDVAITLVIPLLHRISQTDPGVARLSLAEEKNLAAVDAEIEKLQRQLDQLLALRLQLANKQESKLV